MADVEGAGAPSSDDGGAAKGEGELAATTRRRFLRQVSVVAGVSAAAGWAALAPPNQPFSLRDPDGERGKPARKSVRLKEGGFAVDASPTAARLGVARGERVEAMVRAAVDAIGGMSRFVKRGERVLIKPNVAFERVAALGATTNPEVLVALILLAREAGAAEVRVVDNPIEAAEACFERSGIRTAAVRAGARVYLPTPSDFEPLVTPGATLIERWSFFHRPFVGIDKVIGVAPVKDHNLCSASMTTKNWYGLLGGRRNQFHQDIHTIITDLARMLRPTFVVLDGTRVLWRSGPTGGSLADVRLGRTIVASTDSLTADAFGWDELLARDPAARPAYLARAAAAGLGDPDWRSQASKETQVG
ncbi:MAG: DUF362 domain-containing protein [bacterium]